MSQMLGLARSLSIERRKRLSNGGLTAYRSRFLNPGRRNGRVRMVGRLAVQRVSRPRLLRMSLESLRRSSMLQRKGLGR